MLHVANRKREVESKYRALADLRRDADLASHLLDDSLADGQSETGAAELALDRFVCLNEVLKKPRHLRRSYSDSCVGYCPFYGSVRVFLAQTAHLDSDVASIREFDRICEQVEQDLPEASGIADQRLRHVVVDSAFYGEPFGDRANRSDTDRVIELGAGRKYELGQT